MKCERRGTDYTFAAVHVSPVCFRETGEGAPVLFFALLACALFLAVLGLFRALGLACFTAGLAGTIFAVLAFLALLLACVFRGTFFALGTFLFVAVLAGAILTAAFRLCIFPGVCLALVVLGCQRKAGRSKEQGASDEQFLHNLF